MVRIPRYFSNLTREPPFRRSTELEIASFNPKLMATNCQFSNPVLTSVANTCCTLAKLATTPLLECAITKLADSSNTPEIPHSTPTEHSPAIVNWSVAEQFRAIDSSTKTIAGFLIWEWLKETKLELHEPIVTVFRTGATRGPHGRGSKLDFVAALDLI